MNKYAIYKGRAITTTYREVLERISKNGDERAQQLVANLQFIDDK